MKEYQVHYYLGEMLHGYIIEANNEAEAIARVIGRMPEGSKKIMHDFRIERYYQPW